MDAKDLRRLRPELEMFLDHYLPLFGRPESQGHAGRFVQGLLAGGDRRNIENIAETINGAVPRSMQKFLGQGCWQDRRILDELAVQVSETLGDEDAVLNIDETGFPKKGTKSVGVKRQYAGILGRTDNCQIAVFINYCSALGHTLLDRRLFLPEEWAADGERREKAGVPEGVIFRSKAELGLEMVESAARAGVPFRWVGGDSLYGDSPTFVQGVRLLEKWYVLDTSSNARVWTSEPTLRSLGKGSGGGRPRTKPKAIEKPVSVAELIAALPSQRWKRITVAEGSQGPRVYEYTERTVWFSEEGSPAAEPERLLLRRSLGQDPQIKYQRCNAPAEVPLSKLAQVGGGRWSIEQDFQAAKGECGLDEYETRGWVGWHHHTCLSMLAKFFLVLQRQRLEKKRTADDRPRSPRRTPAFARPSVLGRRGDPRPLPAPPKAKPSVKGMSYSETCRRKPAAK